MSAHPWRAALMAALAIAVFSGPALAQRSGGGGAGGGGAGGGRGGGRGDASAAGGRWYGHAFTGEWREMVDALKFDGAQKTALWKIVMDGNAYIQESNQAKVVAIRQKLDAKTDAERRAAEERLQKIQSFLDKIDLNMKTQAFETIMNAEQKAFWTAYVLNRLFTRELRGVALTLSDEQSVVLKDLCDKAGVKTPCADAANNTQLVESVRKDVVAKVLTGEQNRRYAAGLRGRDDPDEARR